MAAQKVLRMRRQRGMALLVFVAVVGIVAVTVMVRGIAKAHNPAARDRITAASLAKAKQALLAWSVARGAAGSADHPGELPCPDNSAPGTPTYGDQATACAAGAIGRLPWRTLGIEELRDASGEPLWYARDAAFALVVHGAADTVATSRNANLRVYASDGTTLLTAPSREAAAVVFAPGIALGNQGRANAAQQVQAAQYLDSIAPPLAGASRNNAMAAGPFIQGSIGTADGQPVLNDRLAYLTAHELMQAVQSRLDREAAAGQ
ncbi:MAG TPA: hypothetical protein VIM12_13260 [Noviherbaspirillum sp.]|uniref:hypothetical protein n=1 Tax=Noviherbaspirillum sp. TaxID=1926288 RepID=UPI002F92B8A5